MKLLLNLSILLFFACSKKELKYSKEDLYAKARAAEPSVTFILPKNMNEGVSCANYSDGCLAGHTVEVRKIAMIAVEFMTEEQAMYAAKKYRGYYSRNWLFDDVTGEPTLEKFVVEVLEAKKP